MFCCYLLQKPKMEFLYEVVSVWTKLTGTVKVKTDSHVLKKSCRLLSYCVWYTPQTGHWTFETLLLCSCYNRLTVSSRKSQQEGKGPVRTLEEQEIQRVWRFWRQRTSVVTLKGLKAGSRCLQPGKSVMWSSAWWRSRTSSRSQL